LFLQSEHCPEYRGLCPEYRGLCPEHRGLWIFGKVDNLFYNSETSLNIMHFLVLTVIISFLKLKELPNKYLDF
jgi:hypothetical protein